MESQLTEALTFPATSYSSNFFHALPSDDRFLQNTFQKFMPSSSIDEPQIDFCLDRYDSASIYLINQTCVKLPEKVESMEFCNFKSKLKRPYVVYADFECSLIK